MKVAVLFGGVSDEREVSIASGVQVCAALRDAGHEVVALDTAVGPVSRAAEDDLRLAGVQMPAAAGANGALDPASFLRHLQGPAFADVDVCFIALHGGAGEDGSVQATLDVLGVPYTGSDHLGCALAMDKDVTKRLLRDAGIDTPPWIAGLPSADQVEAELGLPVVVKAASGGSSLRLHLARDRSQLEAALVSAADFGDLPISEGFVAGRELTVAILGDRALPVGEIVPEHELFDYECKYQPGMAAEIFPAPIDEALAQRLQDIALRVHALLRLRDVSRIDFLVDADGRAWCLEANALPGMTANSLLPRAARAAGLTFAEVCDELVQRAARRS